MHQSRERLKIATIVGNRPQFIKSSTITREILGRKDSNFDEIYIHTGQHYDANMSDIFFKELNIPTPKYNLDINGGSNSQQLSRMVKHIESSLIKEKPDACLLYGDTNSTLAGAITAKNLSIPVIHVEAGLRSNNIDMQEEVNRLITDRLSSFLFCPNVESIENLKKENILKNVFDVGDVMYDSFVYFSNLFKEKEKKKSNQKYIFSTIHRKENTNNVVFLKNIFDALELVATEIQVIMPLHPRTKKYLQDNQISISNITIIEPQSYISTLNLVSNSEMVVTDSGGLQKEAFFAKKTCVTLRKETEWRDTLINNCNTLCYPDNKDSIVESIRSSYSNLSHENFFGDYFGNGRASKKIIDILLKLL